MDWDFARSVLATVATHGPWALLCWYLVYQHFRLSAQNIEVMTALKTLIENLECQKKARP